MANVPISAFTVPANTVGIGGTGYSLTGSASASFMDLAGTWNTSGTPTAIKLNITDTASNAASLLMDLQVGGASFGSLAKNGTLTAGRYAASGFSGMQFNASTGVIGLSRSSDGAVVTSWNANSNSFNVGTATVSATLVLGGSSDLLLTRRGAANLRLGAADAAAPVAQTLSVQSVVAGTTNTAGTNLTITGSQGTGTGAGGSIVFQVAPPAGSSGSAQNALATALTINPDRSVSAATSMTIGDGGGVNGTLNIGIGQSTGLVFISRGKIFANGDGVFTMRDNAGTSFGRLTFGGVSSSFPALKRSTTFLQAVLADDSAACGFSAANVQAATAYTVATLPTTPGTGMIARVTDALAPAVGATVAAGGAAYALVNYNGANWTVIGV